jgi:3-hydroxy-9,10-secoandrosta-1,3,5(10)-triene-9,17-dione monooxygenase
LLVPAHRYLSGAKANEGEYATPFRDEALYHSAFVPVAALVLLGPPFGLSQAALDFVIGKASKRGITGTF